MRILPAIVVFGVAGAGYVYHQEQAGQTAPLSKLLSTGASFVESVIGDDSEDDPGSSNNSKTSNAESTVPSTSADSTQFANIFRFDLTPDQLRQSTNRVSPIAPDGKLRGFRLPLVTGEEPHDLSGSLVYYFDSEQARRITFAGSSSDPRLLIEFLSGQFGFQRVNSRNPKVETYSSRKNCSGLLRITPAETSQGRAQIDLSIAR